MERKEIEELVGLAHVLNEIDSTYSDPESITLKQLSELSQAHHLAIPDLMALVTLIRWGRIYRCLKELGEKRDEEIGSGPDLSFFVPDDPVRETAKDLHPSGDGRDGRHSIEFL